MGVVVLIDGRLVAPEAATVSVFDRGFLYGDSVFETLRTYGRRPFEVDAHLARLERSAALVHIDVPVTRAALKDELSRAIDAADNPESYLRLMVTRGVAPLGLDPGLATAPCRVLIAAPLITPPPAVYDDGVAVITFRAQRAADGTEAAGAKIGSYLVAVLATRLMKEHGASEALIVDGHGRVVEGATSNVFALLGGRLVTPPEDAGILAGVTRALVLELAAQLGIEVELRAPSVTELLAADELMITSTLREIVPVVTLDGNVIGGGRPGAMVRRLRAAFAERVAASSA